MSRLSNPSASRFLVFVLVFVCFSKMAFCNMLPESMVLYHYKVLRVYFPTMVTSVVDALFSILIAISFLVFGVSIEKISSPITIQTLLYILTGVWCGYMSRTSFIIFHSLLIHVALNLDYLVVNNGGKSANKKVGGSASSAPPSSADAA